jgi:Zn-dependent M28 family amino/carboxypeptidase
MRSILLAFTAALALSGPAMAQTHILDDVRTLSADNMQGRRIGTPGGAMARTYIEHRLTQIGLTPVEQPFQMKSKRNGKVNGVNLIARINGSDPKAPVIIVTAHYDHLGVIKGEIYNGADDNASGVAGLLAVAETLKAHPPKHTVIFAVLDGEENGLLGARWLVQHPPVALGRIGLNLNFDMLSKNPKNELYVSGAYAWPALKPTLDAVAAKAPVKLLLGHDDPKLGKDDDWTNQSDHYAFHLKGIPWLYFGVEDHPEYHKPTDDFATIPQDFFKRSVETVIAATQAFDADLPVLAHRKS